jgi:Flp pilus assembly pilin Flp
VLGLAIAALRRGRRLLAGEAGQDLVEYALLAAFVALASVIGINALRGAMLAAYTSWNTATQNCWQMPAPGAGGGCP